MTVFTVTVYMQNYTLTSKQSNKHILIVVKYLQLSTNNIESATEIGLSLIGGVNDSGVIANWIESWL